MWHFYHNLYLLSEDTNHILYKVKFKKFDKFLRVSSILE